LVSKVFFADMRANKAEQNVYAKIQRLFDAVSMRDLISKGDLVAVKVHIGTGESIR
jgi:uncharacterized Fe-S center protein